MKLNKIYTLLMLNAALAVGCNDNNSGASLQTCSVNQPCTDSSTVCVNQLCIPKCTKDSCGSGFICSDSGICEAAACKELTDPVCGSDKVCYDGSCVPRECTAENSAEKCGSGKVCEDYKCVIDQQGPAKKCTSANEASVCDATEVCQNGYCRAKCTTSTECGKQLVCDTNEGRCITPCVAGSCPEGNVCERGIRLCVPGKCSWYDECQSGQVCDESVHECKTRCTKGSCGTGTVCGEDGLCIAGECSKIDNTCADASKVCDASSLSCVTKCSKDNDCAAGMLCDTDGLCVKPCKAGSCEEGKVCTSSGLCIPGECSNLDRCYADYKICVGNVCIDKCKKDADCADNNKFCNTSNGMCETRCTAKSCPAGSVCTSSGKCEAGNCSDILPCPGDRVCASNVCVDKGELNNDCYFYMECEPCDGKYNACLDSCDETAIQQQYEDDKNHCEEVKSNCTADYETCTKNYHGCMQSSDESHDRLIEKCEKNLACKPLKETLDACEVAKSECTEGETQCAAKYEECASAVSASYVENECADSKCISEKKACEKNRLECESRNKPCSDSRYQCNANNQCVLKAAADGLGLGEVCNDGNGNVNKCASDLTCHKTSAATKSYCRSKVYEQNNNPCSSGAFVEYCAGNIIVECDENYGRISIQDCKTNYVNISAPTTGTFHGDNFYCMRRPGTKFVTCAEQCSTTGAEKFICGWDIDDYDVDYSDRYVCQYNSDGVAGYFPVSSETCKSTCDYESGRCD